MRGLGYFFSNDWLVNGEALNGNDDDADDDEDDDDDDDDDDDNNSDGVIKDRRCCHCLFTPNESRDAMPRFTCMLTIMLRCGGRILLVNIEL